MTRSPSMVRPARDLGREPVATTRLRALIASPLPLTTTLCSDSMVPSPLKTVTLFFFSRNSTPRQSWLTTASLRLSTAGQSTCRPSVFRPSAPALWIWWASSDECRNDFVGMQPRCRQVPPTFSFSMTATLSPNWAPRIAPTYPAEPPPMTATSNASSGIQNDCRRHPAAHLTLQQRECRAKLRVLREVVWGPVNRIFVLRVGQGDGLVGRDAGLVDRLVIGCQPDGDRQVEVTIAKGEILLHRTLAEGLDAHELRPAMVFDRAGGDLGGARRVLVEEHDQAVAEGATGAGDLLRLLLAAARHEDGAGPLADELTDDVVGGIHVSARVIPQIEHDHVDRSLEVVPERLVELGRGPAAELEDSHVEDAVVEDMGGDAWHVDVLAGDVEAQRLAVPAHLELDRGSRLATNVIHGIVGGPALGALPVDCVDDVARLQPGFLRRCSRHDADEDDLVRFLLDGGADAGELAAEEALVGTILVGRQVAGELVTERVDHAGCGTLGQLDAAGIGLDIVLLDGREHVVERTVVDIRFRRGIEEQRLRPIGREGTKLKLGEAAAVERANRHHQQDRDVLGSGHQSIIVPTAY